VQKTIPRWSKDCAPQPGTVTVELGAPGVVMTGRLFVHASGLQARIRVGA
jgi:hypothetical protein